ncbi:MAG: hypothetical protein LBE91_22435 [Tannerella sp.]|jgi:hypothetical protein|nr:hypothetical protein [Tannerella sp.]
MAKQDYNVVTHGLSGKVGDLLVFRQVAGKTIVGKVPRKSDKVTEKQLEQRKKFQSAILYGKTPENRELYEEKASKKGKTSFHVAVADFLNAPNIENIDISGYTGMPGDTIRIRVTDDFAVREVTVLITNADGTKVEKAQAVPDSIGYEWTFTAAQENVSLDGDKIEISVSDTPGNLTAEERTL